MCLFAHFLWFKNEFPFPVNISGRAFSVIQVLVYLPSKFVRSPISCNSLMSLPSQEVCLLAHFLWFKCEFNHPSKSVCSLMFRDSSMSLPCLPVCLLVHVPWFKHEFALPAGLSACSCSVIQAWVCFACQSVCLLMFRDSSMSSELTIPRQSVCTWCPRDSRMVISWPCLAVCLLISLKDFFSQNYIQPCFPLRAVVFSCLKSLFAARFKLWVNSALYSQYGVCVFVCVYALK